MAGNVWRSAGQAQTVSSEYVTPKIPAVRFWSSPGQNGMLSLMASGAGGWMSRSAVTSATPFQPGSDPVGDVDHRISHPIGVVSVEAGRGRKC